MSAAHTPGPWELLPTETEGDLLGTTIVGSNLGGLVGMAMPWPTEIDSEDYRRVEANARLIAAAPSVYDAAVALYMAGRWSCDRPVDEAALWEALRDALGLPEGTATDAGVSA